jgi:general secretion pathway protein B
MSYILNALRKSEQERKAIQAESSPAAILLPPEKIVAPRKSKHVILLAVAINLLALAYVYFKVKQPVQSDVKPTIAVAPPIVAHQDRPKLATEISTQPVMPATASAPTISDLWAGRKQAQEAEALKAPLPKPKLPVKKKTPVVLVNKEHKSLSNPLPVKMPAGLEIEKPPEAPEIKVEPPPLLKFRHSTSIPLLRELSPDFQAKVPVLTINVLAYAEQPSDRFVIIDMVKYRIGERIKAKVNLRNILPDTVVLNFEGQDFRLERP